MTPAEKILQLEAENQHLERALKAAKMQLDIPLNLEKENLNFKIQNLTMLRNKWGIGEIKCYLREFAEKEIPDILAGNYQKKLYNKIQSYENKLTKI